MVLVVVLVLLPALVHTFDTLRGAPMHDETMRTSTRANNMAHSKSLLM